MGTAAEWRLGGAGVASSREEQPHIQGQEQQT